MDISTPLKKDKFILPGGKKYSRMLPEQIHAHPGLGMKDWILLLPADQLITEQNNFTNLDGVTPSFKRFVLDTDVVSSYPTVIAKCNVSKATCVTEMLEVEGVSEDEFRRMNINSMYGNVTAFSYCIGMFNYPTMDELLEEANLFLDGK